MSTSTPENHDAGPLLGLGSSEQLGRMVDAAEKYAAKYRDDDRQDITTDVLNAFYAGAKFGESQERERLKADAESWGNALNQAGWAATEAYRRHTGQVEPAIFFNHAKGILRDALAVYFKALRA